MHVEICLSTKEIKSQHNPTNISRSIAITNTDIEDSTKSTHEETEKVQKEFSKIAHQFIILQ